MTGTATDRPGLQAHVYTKTQKKRLEKQAEALAAAWSAGAEVRTGGTGVMTMNKRH